MKTFVSIRKDRTYKQGEDILGWSFVIADVDLNPHFMVSAKVVNMGLDFKAQTDVYATRVKLSNKETYFLLDYDEVLKGKVVK